MRLYSLRDVKAGEYLAPFEAANDVAARRSAIDLLTRDPATNRFVRYREDYVLVRLADFDAEDTGCFTADSPSILTTLAALYDDLRAQEARDA